MRRRVLERLAPWLATAALFGIWEGACVVFKVDEFVLPRPSAALAALIEFREPIWQNALATLETTAAGLGIAVGFGLMLGLALGASPLLYRALYPVLVGFNSVPKAAVVPVLVIWFGGFTSAVLTAFLISFFPIAVNVATGVATLEPELRDLLRSLGARRLDILLKVGLPRSLPYFFAALKVAVTLAFVGSIVSEMSLANDGIGHLMLSASSSSRISLVFAGLFVVAGMGMGMYAVFAAIERWLTGWAFRGDGGAR